MAVPAAAASAALRAVILASDTAGAAANGKAEAGALDMVWLFLWFDEHDIPASRSFYLRREYLGIR